MLCSLNMNLQVKETRSISTQTSTEKTADDQTKVAKEDKNGDMTAYRKKYVTL